MEKFVKVLSSLAAEKAEAISVDVVRVTDGGFHVSMTAIVDGGVFEYKSLAFGKDGLNDATMKAISTMVKSLTEIVPGINIKVDGIEVATATKAGIKLVPHGQIVPGIRLVASQQIMGTCGCPDCDCEDDYEEEGTDITDQLDNAFDLMFDAFTALKTALGR